MEAAIWHRREALRFMDPNFEYWALRVEKCGEEQANFATVTIPMLMEEYGLTRIDILKVEIEGAERELLLEGDTSWLNCGRLLTIELHGEMAHERFDGVNLVIAQHGLRLIREGENCVFLRDKEKLFTRKGPVSACGTQKGRQ
jgi:Methyltransferase FkbM domain